MAATNSDVARAWALGDIESSVHMSTDGSNIFSYRHLIGYTSADPHVGKVAICCHYSMTTAHHCSLVKAQAQQVIECSKDYRPQCRVYRASKVAS